MAPYRILRLKYQNRMLWELGSLKTYWERWSQITYSNGQTKPWNIWELISRQIFPIHIIFISHQYYIGCESFWRDGREDSTPGLRGAILKLISYQSSCTYFKHYLLLYLNISSNRYTPSFFIFIWANKHSRISRPLLTIPKQKGGLAVFIQVWYHQAALLSHLIDWSRHEDMAWPGAGS